MLLFNIMEELEAFFESIKEFVLKHQENPILWIGIVFGVLFLYEYMYNALSKNK